MNIRKWDHVWIVVIILYCTVLYCTTVLVCHVWCISNGFDQTISLLQLTHVYPLLSNTSIIVCQLVVRSWMWCTGSYCDVPCTVYGNCTVWDRCVFIYFQYRGNLYLINWSIKYTVIRYIFYYFHFPNSLIWTGGVEVNRFDLSEGD